MIVDSLDNADRYLPLHGRFAAAFAFLRRPDLATLATGKHAIEGEALFAIVARESGRARAAAKLEAHRRYVDIQFVITGPEEMGWRPLHACRRPEAEYGVERDIVFFADPPATWLTVDAGQFCVFFPEDAHAPLVATASIHKVVVKVALDLAA